MGTAYKNKVKQFTLLFGISKPKKFPGISRVPYNSQLFQQLSNQRYNEPKSLVCILYVIYLYRVLQAVTLYYFHSALRRAGPGGTLRITKCPPVFRALLKFDGVFPGSFAGPVPL